MPLPECITQCQSCACLAAAALSMQTASLMCMTHVMGLQAHPWFRKDWPLLDLDQVNAVRAVVARGKPVTCLVVPSCALGTVCIASARMTSRQVTGCRRIAGSASELALL